jgi:hypothetical protein
MKNKQIKLISIAEISFLVLIAILMGGCAATHRITINSYVDKKYNVAIKPTSSFHVMEKYKPKNPFLESEIIFKIEKLLRSSGYVVSDYDYDYLVFPYYGVRSSETSSYLPLYQPGVLLP